MGAILGLVGLAACFTYFYPRLGPQRTAKAGGMTVVVNNAAASGGMGASIASWVGGKGDASRAPKALPKMTAEQLEGHLAKARSGGTGGGVAPAPAALGMVDSTRVVNPLSFPQALPGQRDDDEDGGAPPLPPRRNAKPSLYDDMQAVASMAESEEVRSV